MPEFVILSWTAPAHIIPQDTLDFMALVYVLFVKIQKSKAWKEQTITSATLVTIWDPSPHAQFKLVAVGPNGAVATTYPLAPVSKSDTINAHIALRASSETHLNLAQGDHIAILDQLGLTDLSKRHHVPPTNSSHKDGPSITLQALIPSTPAPAIEGAYSFSTGLIVTLAVVTSLALSGLSVLVWILRNRKSDQPHSIIYKSLVTRSQVHGYSANTTTSLGWV